MVKYTGHIALRVEVFKVKVSYSAHKISFLKRPIYVYVRLGYTDFIYL